MFLTFFIIQQRFAVDALFQMLLRHHDILAVLIAVEHHHFQRIQSRAGIAVGKIRNYPQQIVIQVHMIIAEAPRIL